MIRKFVTVPTFGIVLAAILAGATTVCAQQAPTQQPPAQTPADQSSAGQSSAGQSSSQEATPEDIGTRRKVKVKDYKNWTFNVGGGGGLTNGTTTKFARSGGCPRRWPCASSCDERTREVARTGRTSLATWGRLSLFP